MRTFTTLTLSFLMFTGGFALPLIVAANPSPGWERGRMHDGRMMHDGPGHDYGHNWGHNWKASLTDDQSKKIDKLRLSYKKEKYLIKAKLKQAKTEFALLITSDSPDKSDINKKIDQIVKLKKEKLQLKANYKINVRKLLTEDQRVKFDLAVLEKMSKGKGGMRGYR